MAVSPHLETVLDIARAAGREIMAVYGAGGGDVTQKSDASPLTEADLRAHRLIVRELSKLTPDVPILSEEASDIDFAIRSAWKRYWLVDPLDGTKEFISRNGEFTVNIALIEAHQPTFGVVHVPVRDVDYWGQPGVGAWRRVGTALPEAIAVNRTLGASVRIAGSRSHRGNSLEGFLAGVGVHEFVEMGSSLKFCLIAEGNADVYPRLGPTSEWDTAAGHAVLVGAGGAVLRLDGTALAYNTRESLLNPFFLAYGSAARDWLALLGTVDGGAAG
jgi:3'(2'), 5'-bisphosphate nucleotidase